MGEFGDKSMEAIVLAETGKVTNNYKIPNVTKETFIPLVLNIVS
jgi:hypothetical protein